MNIFYLSPNTTLCAQAHCDKHVVKMILETAQLLCIASHSLGYTIPTGYKPTHKNHPCAHWVAESYANMRWTIDLLNALNEEYEYRYFPKEHASKYLAIHFENAIDILCYKLSAEWKNAGITIRPQCMPPMYKHINTMIAYQNYYCGEKLKFARWTRRTKPAFVHLYMKQQINKEASEKAIAYTAF